MELIASNGFKNIAVRKGKAIVLPKAILSAYLSAEEASRFRQSDTGIFSITALAQKPDDACCTPGCCSN